MYNNLGGFYIREFNVAKDLAIFIGAVVRDAVIFRNYFF